MPSTSTTSQDKCPGLVVGLTGGIGSGKSTIASHFEALGIDMVDADVLAREVVEPGAPALDAIAQHFGQDFLNPDGSLARQRLREAIFADPAQKDWLEGQLHPLIATLLEERLAACQSPYCLLVSPLLLETSQRQLVQRILVVDVSESTQLERTLRRDQESDPETIRAIMAAQIGRDSRLQQADDILDNEGPEEAIRQRVEALHRDYLKLAEDYEATEAS